MMMLHTMVALDTRQATGSEAVGVDLSADSLALHRMGAGGQAGSSTNEYDAGAGTEVVSRPCTGVVVAGIEAALDISPLAGKWRGNDIAQAEICLAWSAQLLIWRCAVAGGDEGRRAGGR
jgi:hypothetical protein